MISRKQLCNRRQFFLGVSIAAIPRLPRHKLLAIGAAEIQPVATLLEETNCFMEIGDTCCHPIVGSCHAEMCHTLLNHGNCETTSLQSIEGLAEKIIQPEGFYSRSKLV